jgi:uncharacterized repeat protein (TIGR02543 family)
MFGVHPGTMAKWNTLMGYRRVFANGRPEYARTDIMGFFGLTGTWDLGLNVSNADHGSIRLNTIRIEGSEMLWQGVYFDGVPVTLEALPEPGYVFVGWDGDVVGSDNPRQVASNDNLSTTANFLPGAGAVPDGDTVAGVPLTIGRFPDGDLDIQWSASCHASDQDYAVYMGNIGDYSTRDPLDCSTEEATAFRIEPPEADVYFLVVPANGTAEESYGRDSSGDERLPNSSACLPQAVMACSSN